MVKRLFAFFLAVLFALPFSYALVISLSQASIDSNGYGKISGPAFIAEWRSIPTSTDQLLVALDSSSVSQALGEPVTVTNPATVELTKSDYSAAYTFSNAKPVYNVDYVKGSLPGFYISSSSCANDVSNYFGSKNFPVFYAGTYYLNWGTCEYYAFVGANLEGYLANVNFDQREFVNEWTVKQGGQMQGTIKLQSVKNQPQALSGWYSDKVFVNYAGSVQWLFSEPSAANVNGFYDKKSNSWRVVNAQDARNVESLVSTLGGLDAYSFRNVASPDSQFDSAVGALRVSTLPNEWTSSNVVKKDVTGLNENQGEVRVHLTGGVTIPTFKFVINAAWVGIKTTAGLPKIVSANDVSFTEGTTGVLTTVVKNVGDAKGGFSLNAVCGSAFSGTSQQFTLNAGEQSTVTLGIQGKNQDITQDVKGSCTVTMTEVNTLEKDSKTVSVTMRSLDSCTPGEQQAFLDTSGVWGIKECSADGQTFLSKVVCKPGEIVQRSTLTGKLACSDSGLKPPSDENNSIRWWAVAVAVIVGVLAGAVGAWLVWLFRPPWWVVALAGLVFAAAAFIGTGYVLGAVANFFSNLFSFGGLP